MRFRTITHFNKLVAAVFPLLLCCQMAMAQTVSIQGKVTNEEGQGLTGASVAVKGTTNGTITDGEGNYSLSVSAENDVLVISFIGYIQQEISIGNRDLINVQLLPDTKQLNEVIVTALGIEREQKVPAYAAQTVS